MDFQKLFETTDWESGTNLTQKIGKPPKLKTHDYFCMWSDLLGFGKMFYESKWDLSDHEQEIIYNRLQKAHSAVLYFSGVDNERNLILNDGIAKVFKTQENDRHKIFHLSLFLRSAIQLHIAINKVESEYEHPGCRSVLAFGKGIEYLADEIRYDDYVLNYTKPKCEKIDSAAKKGFNPIVVYNPVELQMNTAFAKSYLLESKGSTIGLSGNKFYLDQSVLDSITEIAKDIDRKPIFVKRKEYLEYLLPYSIEDKNSVLLCLRLSNPIGVEINQWKTKVYQLLRFYPHDEKMSEFHFDLNDY